MLNNFTTMKKYLLLLFVLLFSCQVDYGYLTESEKEECKQNVLENGDEECYKDLIFSCEDNNESVGLIPLSYLMANKYNNGYACRNLYESFLETNNNFKVKNDKGQFQNNLILKLNKTDREFALFYLVKGSKLNDFSCNRYLSELYSNGWGVLKDQKKADSLYNLYEINLGVAE
jgi:hypothetical protein